jgi:SAM-dependent methyltransferase
MDSREKRNKIRRIKRKVRRLTWFPSYQEFSEIGIRGRRNERVRYRFLDFSQCRDKLAADYGCNIGQTSIKAARYGARRVIGMDCQEDTLEVARAISNVLEMDNLEFHLVDFNAENFKETVLGIFGGDVPDISFFLSVYRTKELKDRDGLFRFILENTKETVFFEGHSDRKIDTVEYYEDVFRRFGVEYRFLGFSQEDTRPFFTVNPISRRGKP